ncbi:GtrA family protein [Demequina sp. TTPB684]|uniref:GtrA family protein n=1 Tax=unclassified Demequina TaxID=2620311 RepID=UPI001CF21A63|nr:MULTISPECIES: GtrA family protein [unclassified Demequina]MCB2413539.1 GtrA family protein [Demequina sp. TTPB684]UPU87240.1 GtrA family protein [Demequina sp. TMPB413]
MIHAIRRKWEVFTEKRPGFAQFLMFTVFSQAVTVLQLALMPLFRAWFNTTSLLETTFQVFPVGSDVDGSQYYMFDYVAGELPQGGGGLAYFLAVQITLAIAQVINFFLQRNITFKSNTSPWRAAMWYFIAYVIITFIAAAAQGFYKAPVYDFFIDTLGWGSTGETFADVLTMIIYSAISFWVFFPIFKIIFKREPGEDGEDGDDEQGTVPSGAQDSTIQPGEPAPQP